MAYFLEAVGISESDNDAYVVLLGVGEAPVDELADRMAMSVAAVRRTMTRLARAGLATRTDSRPMRFTAVPPDIAVAALVGARRREMRDLRAAAAALERRLAPLPATRPAGVVEIIEGDEAIAHHLARAQLEARDEVVIVDAPPYPFGVPQRKVEELAMLTRGIGYRCVYHRPSLSIPGRFDQVSECVRAGERARVLASASMRMQVVDRRVGLVPISFNATETHSGLLVRSSAVLDALVTSFESLWHRATPIGLALGGGTPGEQALRDLLGTGMDDRAIARALGVTGRTLSRRVRELMSGLGADTRFQAGVETARRGRTAQTPRTPPELVASTGH
ncbi:DNA-binding Lrp family transcriptional regulator [Actinokineospora baliensis]|uniref:helix-turn-helix domain-containing protein n=1 Tax=Actinokineospora baliensis TaxID=547056 RepID=UPI00195993B4|nr:helix-turn-helix domain-containing protein [Actinokineospora baliensis]MBM7774027.1 DNA-binding Lrp family transcriptional regulator [Actinokineospora baliensis]